VCTYSSLAQPSYLAASTSKRISSLPFRTLLSRARRPVASAVAVSLDGESNTGTCILRMHTVNQFLKLHAPTTSCSAPGSARRQHLLKPPGQENFCSCTSSSNGFPPTSVSLFPSFHGCILSSRSSERSEWRRAVVSMQTCKAGSLPVVHNMGQYEMVIECR
jgi:hypothetical protein